MDKWDIEPRYNQGMKNYLKMRVHNKTKELHHMQLEQELLIQQ